MNRVLRIDRRYTLGDYKYVTLDDAIEDIPQPLMFNPEFTGTVRFLQLLNMEITYRKYIKLVSEYPHNMDLDTAIKALEDIRDNEFKRLKIIINGTSLKEDKPQMEEKDV